MNEDDEDFDNDGDLNLAEYGENLSRSQSIRAVTITAPRMASHTCGFKTC